MRTGERDWFGAVLRRIDSMMRDGMGIEEFCRDDFCILGVALNVAKRDVRLADGTHIRKGDTIGELHLRNGNLPKLAGYRSGIAWALAIRRAFEFSFARLARYVETDPRFDDVAAFRGGLAFARRANRAPKVQRVMASLGVDLVPTAPAPFAQMREFGNALFTMFLIRAFNPGGAFGAPRLRRRRHDLWLSRRVLRERYLRLAASGEGVAAAASERAEQHRSAA